MDGAEPALGPVPGPCRPAHARVCPSGARTQFDGAVDGEYNQTLDLGPSQDAGAVNGACFYGLRVEIGFRI